MWIRNKFRVLRMQLSRWHYRTTSSSRLCCRCAFKSEILSFAQELWTDAKSELEVLRISAGCRSRIIQTGATGVPRWGPFSGSSRDTAWKRCERADPIFVGAVAEYAHREHCYGLTLSRRPR